MDVWLTVLVVIVAVLLLWHLRIYSWFSAIFRALKRRLPRLSTAEHQAMKSGDVWWESCVFEGFLDWNELLDFKSEKLTTEEENYLQEVVDPFCACLDNEQIEQIKALPEEAWEKVRQGKLWGITLAKEHGGLGFSPVALASIICRIASRNIAAAITVMVPNTIGPAAFIALYGTDGQKAMLPRFASGEWVGCFALTGPLSGSDAASIQDSGVVCYENGEQGELGLRLQWNKRYITLAPRADYLCLAVRITDPDQLLPEQKNNGITLVLVPTNHPGVMAAHSHQPMTAGLVNGTTSGKDVWLSLSSVLGGEAGLGLGWDMMMNELAAGRGLSLPSLSTALCQMSLRMTHIYVKTRRQFNRPLIAFSGIQNSYVRLAGFALLSKSVHWFTVQGLAKGIRPAIAAAVAKYHLTELARQSVNLGMDIHGGRAAQCGSRNYFTQMYHALPVMVTVEGANILTRHLIIFGQSLIRCHPFVGKEWEALSEPASSTSIKYFEGVFWKHVGSFCWRSCQVVWSRLTGGKHHYVPDKHRYRQILRRWLRLSQTFSWITDAYLLRLGGKLKENETISALLGDVVSHLYMLLCVWMYQREHRDDVQLQSVALWAMNYCLRQAQLALIALVREFPTRWVGRLMRCIVFPTRLVYDEIKGDLSSEMVQKMMADNTILDHLTNSCYQSTTDSDQTGRMEGLNRAFAKSAPSLERLRVALGKNNVSACFGNDWSDLAIKARTQGLSEDDCVLIEDLAKRCWDVQQVD